MKQVVVSKGLGKLGYTCATLKILTTASAGRQFIQLIILFLRYLQTLLLNIIQFTLVFQLILCGRQVIAQHLLLYALPFLARIL